MFDFYKAIIFLLDKKSEILLKLYREKNDKVYLKLTLAQLAHTGATSTACYKPAHYLVKRINMGLGTKNIETITPREMEIEHMYFENTNEAEKLMWQYRCGKQTLGAQVRDGYTQNVQGVPAAPGNSFKTDVDTQYTEDNYGVLTPLYGPLAIDSIAKRNEASTSYTAILEIPHTDRIYKVPYSAYEGAVYYRFDWAAKDDVVLFNANTGAYPGSTPATTTVTGQQILAAELIIEGFKVSEEEIQRAQHTLVKSNISNYYWPVTETFETLAGITKLSQKFDLTERVGFMFFYALDKVYYEKTNGVVGGNSTEPYYPLHMTSATGNIPTFSFGSYTKDNVWIGKDFPLSELVDVSATLTDSGLFPALTNFPTADADYFKGSRLASRWTSPPIYRIDFTNSMLNAWEFGEMNGGMQVNNGKATLKINGLNATTRSLIWKFHFFVYKEISFSASGLKVKYGPAGVDPLRLDME